MNRALISALLSVGVVAGSMTAQAQTKGHAIRISEPMAGAKFQPVRDPTRFPVCRPCARLLDQLDNRSFS